MYLLAYLHCCDVCCGFAAQLTSWSLIMFGTASRPRYLADYLSSKFPTTARMGERSVTSVSRHSSSNETAAQRRNISITAASTITPSTPAVSARSTSAGVGELNLCGSYVHTSLPYVAIPTVIYTLLIPAIFVSYRTGGLVA